MDLRPPQRLLVLDNQQFLAADCRHHRRGRILIERNDIVNQEGMVVLFKMQNIACFIKDIQRSQAGATSRDFGDAVRDT